MINQAPLYPTRRTLNWFKFFRRAFGRMNLSLKKIPVPGRDPKEITLHTKKKASLTTPESENLSKKEGLRKQW